MRMLASLTLLLCVFTQTLSQKKLLDSEAFAHWNSLKSSWISNDGKFVLYTYENDAEGNCLIISTATGKQLATFRRARNIMITENSHYTIFLAGEDSLCVYNLREKSLNVIKNVKRFSVSENATGEWLIYKSAAMHLVCHNLMNNTERVLLQVKDYLLNPAGGSLLLHTTTQYGTQLEWLNLYNGHAKKIYSDCHTIGHFTFDDAGLQFSCIARRSGDSTNHLIYYKHDMDNAIVLADSKTMKNSYLPDDMIRFSIDGERIFFKLNEVPLLNDTIPKKITSALVDIWSYTDVHLQSEQLDRLNNPKKEEHLAAIEIATRKIVLMEGVERDVFYHPWEGKKGLYLLSETRPEGEIGAPYTKGATLFLTSIKDGRSIEILGDTCLLVFNAMLSPNEQFVIWFDFKKKRFYSYDIEHKIIHDLSKDIPTVLYADEAFFIRSFGFGVGGWLQDDKALFLYDRYDIWQVDPLGNNKPVNITNGVGSMQSTIFSFVQEDKSQIFSPNATVLLAGFNKKNKQNGFWKKKLDRNNDPAICLMGDYIYCIPRIAPGNFYTPISWAPVKAKYTDIFMVRRSNDTAACNLYLTRDFKSLQPISHLAPHKNYNWLKATLIHWTLPDDSTGTAILYKPENFNPASKYPVIFFYYEELTDGLFEYPTPALSNSTLNIPWYVSNGYLVCVPDIKYVPGYTGASTVNAVVSAAQYLSRFPWVDSTKLGLQGHSFGGYETNYLVTHSNIFAAAVSTSGLSDLISDYGSLYTNGYSHQGRYEIDQFNIQATLAERPDLYIANSPVLHVANVNTPLLLMHNKLDGSAPFGQAVELFLAMRRAGKRIWLLQYDDEGHGATSPVNQLDFTTRMEQFFNHYLKGGHPPKWMTTGIPAIYKGIDSGLEPDTSGRRP